MRLVLDTNTLVSALLWGGVSEQLLAAAAQGRVELFSTEALIGELAGVLTRAKFTPRILRAQRTPSQLLEQYRGLVEIVEPAIIAPTVRSDPDDDRVLACALAARAEIIVSGDTDLLNLKRFHDIDIVAVGEAIKRIDANR